MNKSLLVAGLVLASIFTSFAFATGSSAADEEIVMTEEDNDGILVEDVILEDEANN
jgi:hypothetical protein